MSKKNEPPIQSGTVFCIFANLQALQYDVRYTDINMNRCFGKDIPQQNNDYEAQRVQELIPYLQQSDVLLDIHNTIDLPCPPFLISEHADWNRYFDVPRVLS
ncbi:hypothetical protein GW750_03990 [bacterium]|nr:hypothetical protein [bacterium]